VLKVGSGTRKNGDVTESGQGGIEMPCWQVTTDLTQITPTSTRNILGTDDQVEATTPCVRINNERAQAAPIRGDRQVDGECRRPHATRATDNGGDPAVSHRTVGARAKGLDQPSLALGQFDNMLSPHFDGESPHIPLPTRLDIAGIRVTAGFFLSVHDDHTGTFPRKVVSHRHVGPDHDQRRV
jgi:hypothetical protein